LGVKNLPPPDCGEVLRDLAIPARLIDGMILTHCHADHDAGAFQKILADSSIKIYTTQTIMDSFIRKYSASWSIACVARHGSSSSALRRVPATAARLARSAAGAPPRATTMGAWNYYGILDLGTPW
jgi:hypothetical protein